MNQWETCLLYGDMGAVLVGVFGPLSWQPLSQALMTGPLVSSVSADHGDKANIEALDVGMKDKRTGRMGCWYVILPGRDLVGMG